MPAVLQFASLVFFTLGVPTFAVVAIALLRRRRTSGTLLPVFTSLCAFAMLYNLLTGAGFRHAAWIDTLCLFGAGLLPVMMAHLLYQQAPPLRAKNIWRAGLVVLYVLAVSSTAGAPSTMETLSQPMVLVAVAVFALCLILTTPAADTPARHHRMWNLGIFSALLLSAAIYLIVDNPFLLLFPDYLVLVFLVVRLYYMEKLLFFDTFVRGVAYLGLGAVLASTTLLLPLFGKAFARDWAQTSVAIFALLPLWSLGPYLLRFVTRWTDRALHRRYSAAQAERMFWDAMPSGGTLEEIRTGAARIFAEIFDCKAEVGLGPAKPTVSADDLMLPIRTEAYVQLRARVSQVPFLSADRRLAETLVNNLDMVLQNVRLRAQQTEQMQREQALAALTVRAELRALRAQINPHFLFNALNAVAGWIRLEPDYADETLEQLTEVFRYTLRHSESEWVTVREEMDFVQAYLAVERARFRDRLEIDIKVDQRALNFAIPTMLIQPLVENAIKHGTSKILPLGRLHLKVQCTPLNIEIRVTDNGCGFPPDFSVESPGDRHGLWNVSERLKGYYADRGSLRWSQSTDGNSVVITLPGGVSQ